MDTNTPNARAPGGGPVTPGPSTERIISNLELTAETNTEGMNALRAALVSMQTTDMDAQRAATVRLNEVIKKEKKKVKEKKEREEKEKERKVKEEEEEKREEVERKKREKREKAKEKREKAKAKAKERGERAKENRNRKKKAKEQDTKEKESEQNPNTTTITATTRWVMTAALIPARPINRDEHLDFTNMATGPTSSPIMRGEASIEAEVTEAPRARAPRNAPCGPHRRSMRILESARKSAQGELAVTSTAQEEGVTITNALVEEVVAGPNGQAARKTMAKVGIQKGKRGPVKAVPKAKSPALKPRAGAGVTKRSIPRSLNTAAKTEARATGEAEREAEMEVEMEGETETETEMEVEVEMEMENQSSTNTITADKATKASRIRAPRRAPQAPQRKSRRILERTRKSAQDKPAVASTMQDEGEATRGSPVEETVPGPSGQVAANTMAKVGTENQKGGCAKALPRAGSPVLKPKAGAGVTKRGGRDGGRGGRRGKSGGGKRALA